METTDDAPKLFRLTHHHYVQYDPAQGWSKEILDYQKSHAGELPAFFLLPTEPVEFQVYSHGHIKWSGQGPLPDEVMQYVSENGVLPGHDAPDAPDL